MRARVAFHERLTQLFFRAAGMGQQVEAAALLLVLSAFLVQALCSCACAALLYWVLTSNGTDPAVATLFAGVLACKIGRAHV